MTPTSPRQEFIFANGHRIGKFARLPIPGGIEIERDPENFDGMIEKFRELIQRGADVIYEATFKSRNVLIMADILVRNGDAWDFYEVKASTGLKPQHKPDEAIQRYVIREHLPLAKAHIVHIDSDYVFDGELDINRLLAIEDITSEVLELQAGLDQKLASMSDVLSRHEPDIPIGLLQPFQQLMNYHPDFNGSFSIKSVLPALLPDDAALDYKALEIQAGDMASMIYASLDRIDDEDERRKIRASLLEHCKLDTLVTVMIWRKLSGVATGS